MRLPPSPSLRLRLALWYLAVLAAVLIVFGTVIYVEERGSLLGGVDANLYARAETIASQVRMDPDGVRYQNGDAPAAEAETAVYLFHTDGKLRETVFGATKLPWRPTPVRAALRGHDNYTTIGSLRLYTAGLRDDNGQIVGAVQVVHSLRGVQAHLDRLLLLLALATPTLLSVAALGGLLVAARALGPLERVTRIAQEIRAGNLDDRIGLAPRDDEIGRLANTFDSMLDRLERAFTQQRQFVADASHELRTPLTIIKGDLDVLLRRPRSPAEYEEIMRDVDEEVTRLSRMVGDLLILARADSGQAEIAQELVSLDALVDDVVAGMRRLAVTSDIIIETSLQREAVVLGDSAWLRQLLLNLLDNAVKYTPAGGRVGVSLGIDGGWARVDVADTGCGIAPDDLPRIFDRFFRTDAARTRTEGGTGLGLAIARWCAEVHGGQISVASEPGRGSVFTVRLPLAGQKMWGHEPVIGAVAQPAAG